ncbi:MAG: DUF1858 domain-containing protein [Clostridia bacterium]|nr:DUF1858 domain-containing protein [Clostridia bacterium]MCR5695286.1 DUF1858 domain-containing protein [Clostridia bacterium]
MEITKNDRIGDILMMKENAADILTECGMHCVYCPSAAMETLEEACMVHGLDVKYVLAELNADSN